MNTKNPNPTGFKCKHCKVPVISRSDTRAVLGREHGKHCPRRNK